MRGFRVYEQKTKYRFYKLYVRDFQIKDATKKSQMAYKKPKLPQNTRHETSCINGGNNEMLENNNVRKHEVSRWVYRCKDGNICLTVSVPARVWEFGDGIKIIDIGGNQNSSAPMVSQRWKSKT